MSVLLIPKKKGGKRRRLCFRLLPPTALLCASDQLAIGAMQATEELSLQIPNDVSIAGFDDITVTLYTSPTLTTIYQTHFEKGFNAGQKLIERLYKQDLAVPLPLILPTRLVVRESTAPPSR
jgi:DNA-binding LacI/PurR family transcriptional regulator